MNPLIDLPGIQLESALAVPAALNFRPPTWPPPSDFPVVIDAHGQVKARYGDASWDLSPWNGKACTINFESGRPGVRISALNASLFRQVTAWWLWGPDAVTSAANLQAQHKLLKPLFVACSEAGIAATELWRHPRVIESVALSLSPSGANRALSLLNRLAIAREPLGFAILDQDGLKKLISLLPDHEGQQTPYIPPRIWTYQVLRLRECLDDYSAHREQIEACYRFCLDAYAFNAGSLAQAYCWVGSASSRPFAACNQDRGRKTGRQYYGPFRQTAERFGIDGLLDRWVDATDANSVKALSDYLSLVSLSGLAYCLNFSMMRVDEGAQLRADCHTVERDELGYDIHLLGGITTKTIADGDARWIASPSVSVAIEAMKHIARLRMEAARHDPRQRSSQSDVHNPMLMVGAREPWCQFTQKAGRLRFRSYGERLSAYPALFDSDQLRITEADHAVAHQMTFGLDPERFAVGQVWPLAWHQLRRTGAVNMLASGLVSEASVQYQLKHAQRAMSRYYGQNWYKLKARLDDEATGFYIREKFHALARELAGQKAEEYVSPHGEKRKAQVLEPISEKDHKGLVNDGKAGRVSYRQNFFGGCAKPGDPCPYGGISNIAMCMGYGNEKPCEHVLCKNDPVTRERVRRVQVEIQIRLVDAESDSPLADALQFAVESTQRYFDVVNAV